MINSLDLAGRFNPVAVSFLICLAGIFFNPGPILGPQLNSCRKVKQSGASTFKMTGSTGKDKYSILLPTYNERENLPLIVWLLVKYLGPGMLTSQKLFKIDQKGTYFIKILKNMSRVKVKIFLLYVLKLQ